MSFAFKHFSFFSHTEVPIHAFPRQNTCCAPSPTHLFVGCSNGSVHVLDAAFQLTCIFQAHAFRVFDMAYLEDSRLLLTLGAEEPGCSSATLKLWELPRLLQVHTQAMPSKGTASFTPPQQPVKLVKVFGPRHPEGEITAMSVLQTAGTPSLAQGPLALPTSGLSGAAGGAVAGVLAVAVGLATGMVYVLMLDLPHLDGPKQAPRLSQGVTASKPISLTKLMARPEAGDAWAVTGLALQAPDPSTLVLFVVTECQTLCFTLGNNTKSVLDAQGTPLPACSALWQPGQALTRSGGRNTVGMLLVARDEGLYDYTSDTRAGCTVLEGTKQRLVLLGRLVAVVTQEKSDEGTTSATLRVLDLSHKLIMGSLDLPNVSAVVAWGGPPGTQTQGGTPSGQLPTGDGGAREQSSMLQLVVVSGGGRLFSMREVPLAVQLESLFKRSLHKLALDLARVHHTDHATIASIQQRWGDALYGRGEYDAAMMQYCETLGFLEPSYVIRRFLDAQRIHNLTTYLEQLHDKGLAGADHTTLLLNCYTKLKDVDKLDVFVARSSEGLGVTESETAVLPDVEVVAPAPMPGKNHSRKGSWIKGQPSRGTASPPSGTVRSQPVVVVPAPQQHLRFDAETAVKVLRAAGYPRHALRVAQAARQPDWALDILLEDLFAWDEALEVLDSLPREACATALKRQGKPLVAARPEATTRLLMELCAPAPPGSAATAPSPAFTASVADFAHLFSDTPTALMVLCEFITATAPPGAIADERMLHHTLLELYLTDHFVDRGAESALDAGSEGSAPPHPTPSTPSAPTPALPEAPEEASRAMLAERRDRRDKALALLHNGWPPHMEAPSYDVDHALVLCRMACFTQGLVLLYERMRLHREVLQVHMDAGNHEALIASVQRYGDASRGGDPQLWATVLEYFVEQPGLQCEQQIMDVVAHIEAGGILPPLMVLQLLARNPQLKMSTVRGYMARQLSRDAVEAARDRETSSRLAAETASLKAELTRLKSQARVLQASRCSATGQPLELPAIHFMCGHAYNMRALGDNDKECPLCAPDYKRVVEIRRNMAASGLQQDRFFTELRESVDPFSTVAEHFGRGLMNMTGAALSLGGGGMPGLLMASTLGNAGNTRT